MEANDFKCMEANDFKPYKTRSTRLLNVVKDIPGIARHNGVDNNDAFVNVVKLGKKYYMWN